MSAPKSDEGLTAKATTPSFGAKSSKVNSLKAFTIGWDQQYFCFPFATACQLDVHHFPEAEDWCAGPVSCLGTNCPACLAGSAPARLLPTPAVNMAQPEIGVLRLPLPSGPGQLAHELHEALLVQYSAFDVFRIRRNSRNCFSVDALGAVPPDEDLAGQVEDFQSSLDRDEVDLTSCLGFVTHLDLARHPHVSNSLRIEALANSNK